MEYRSVADLNADVRRLAWEVPTDVDRVAWTSHEGALVGELLRRTRDVPVVAAEALTVESEAGTGRRVRADGGAAVRPGDTVLALTDAVGAREDLRELRRGFDGAAAAFDVRYGAVYADPSVRSELDHVAETVAFPCTFEWDAFPPTLENACVDIDGVLCRDPTPEENDDGERYREFLSTVEPAFVPDERVGWLVTCRLEKYRPETERWLADHGVEYDELVMMDLPNKEARRRRGCHGEYKAEVYASADADLFVESSHRQAVDIARRAERPVYCVGSNELIPPGEAAVAHAHDDPYLVRFAEDPRRFLLAAGRHVAAKGANAVGRTARRLRRN